MAEQSPQLVQKLWNYCNILRDDGLSYGDYVEQDGDELETHYRHVLESLGKQKGEDWRVPATS